MAKVVGVAQADICMSHLMGLQEMLSQTSLDFVAVDAIHMWSLVTMPPEPALGPPDPTRGPNTTHAKQTKHL